MACPASFVWTMAAAARRADMRLAAAASGLRRARTFPATDMNLALSADQTTLRDEARRMLAEQADAARLRRAIDAGGYDETLWRTIARDLGWCAVAIPEDAGGLGLGVFDLALLAEETGRRLAPAPFWSTACLAAPLIDRLAGEPSRGELLSRIAAGAAAAVASPAPASATPFAGPGVRAAATEGGFTLTGRVAPVIDLAAAELILVPAAREDGGLALFVLSAEEGIERRPLPGVDLLRPFGELVLDSIRVGASARIDRAGVGADDVAAALAVARVGLAAEQVGAAQGCFDLTLAYAKERVQFGRTIASFQAIKHRCAALLVDIAEARSLVYGAAAGLDAGAPDAALDCAAAGALAARALFHVAEEAIQLHGGVGATWEYDPHLYLRRAQASAPLLGSPDDRLRDIAGALLGAAA